jgi:pimeloyl-ACP methyl ester carboxylesterase
MWTSPATWPRASPLSRGWAGAGALPGAAPPGGRRVFLPGWAFSGRVLALAEPPLPWIFPDFVPAVAELPEKLLEFLDSQGLDRVHLVGWSLGAHLAVDFALAHPGRVASLELLAMRSHWPAAETEAIRQGLRQSKGEFLRDFYRKCFLGYKKEYRRFVAELEGDLLAECDLALLERALAYLAAWRPPGRLPACPLRCWQGRRDVIAPQTEQIVLPGAALRLLEHGGHAVFFNRELAAL